MNANQRHMADTLSVICNAGSAYDYRLCLGAKMPIPQELIPGRAFRNDWLAINYHANAGWLMDVTMGYAWDGCTGAEDFAMGAHDLASCLVLVGSHPEQAIAMAGPLLGSLVHDLIYQFADEISAAWGWTVRQVLAWGDEVFKWTMLEAGTPKCKAWRYYFAVKYLGYVFNRVCAWWRKFTNTKRGKQ